MHTVELIEDASFNIRTIHKIIELRTETIELSGCVGYSIGLAAYSLLYIFHVKIGAKQVALLLFYGCFKQHTHNRL